MTIISSVVQSLGFSSFMIRRSDSSVVSVITLRVPQREFYCDSSRCVMYPTYCKTPLLFNPHKQLHCSVRDQLFSTGLERAGNYIDQSDNGRKKLHKFRDKLQCPSCLSAQWDVWNKDGYTSSAQTQNFVLSTSLNNHRRSAAVEVGLPGTGKVSVYVIHPTRCLQLKRITTHRVLSMFIYQFKVQ